MEKDLKLELMNELLNTRIEQCGYKNTIAYLLDFGFSAEQIIEMHFDEDDVRIVAEDPDAEYDCE